MSTSRKRKVTRRVLDRLLREAEGRYTAESQKAWDAEVKRLVRETGYSEDDIVSEFGAIT